MEEKSRKTIESEISEKKMKHNLIFDKHRNHMNSNKIWQTQCVLRSHLDGVRGIYFSKKKPSFVSVSEDCLIKFWDIRNVIHSNFESIINPFLTLREHTGPIFTITGFCDNNDMNYVYTGGTEVIFFLIFEFPKFILN